MTGQNPRVNTRLIPEAIDDGGKAANDPFLNGLTHTVGLSAPQGGLCVITRICSVHTDRLKAILETQLSELIRVARPQQAVSRIHLHCEGFESIDRDSDLKVQRFLLAHRVGINTLYMGTRRYSVQQIHRDALLYDALQQALDQLMAKPGEQKATPVVFREALQRQIADLDEFAWIPHAPMPQDRIALRIQDGLLAATVVGLLLLILYSSSVFGVFNSLAGVAVLLGVPALVIALMLRSGKKQDQEIEPILETGDFIDKASTGLTVIWSNAYGSRCYESNEQRAARAC